MVRMNIFFKYQIALNLPLKAYIHSPFFLENYATPLFDDILK